MQLSDEIQWEVEDRDTGAVRARVTMRAGDVAAMPADIRHRGFSPKRSMLLVWENASPGAAGALRQRQDAAGARAVLIERARREFLSVAVGCCVRAHGRAAALPGPSAPLGAQRRHASRSAT